MFATEIKVAKKETLQKSIDYLLVKIRFYDTILIALFTGIIWSIYAIMENKVNINILVLDGVGIVLVFGFIFKILLLDKEIKEKFNELEKEE